MPGLPGVPGMTEHLDLELLKARLGGDPALQQRFVADFVRLWEVRALRLETALGIGDLEDADVVLLSIRSSSRMVGAAVLESVGVRIHDLLKENDVAGCERQLEYLNEVGGHTGQELSEHFSLP